MRRKHYAAMLLDLSNVEKSNIFAVFLLGLTVWLRPLSWVIKMSATFQSWETGHTEFMHDIAYDFYGTRLATCSSDKHITVSKLSYMPLNDFNLIRLQ